MNDRFHLETIVAIDRSAHPNVELGTYTHVYISTIFAVDRKMYETMVFRYDPEIQDTDWEEIDLDVYHTIDEAREGHEKMVKKWKKGGTHQ